MHSCASGAGSQTEKDNIENERYLFLGETGPGDQMLYAAYGIYAYSV